jgi:hypothetical protein
MASIDDRISALETALESNPGVKEIVIDGMKAAYDRTEAVTELANLRRRRARQQGRRPISATINLGGF